MHQWGIIKTHLNSDTTQKDQQSHFQINSSRSLEDNTLKQTCRVPLTSEEPSLFNRDSSADPSSQLDMIKQKQLTKIIFQHSIHLHIVIEEGISTALLHSFSPGLKSTKGQIFTSTCILLTICFALPNQQFLRLLLLNCHERSQLYILFSLQI